MKNIYNIILFILLTTKATAGTWDILDKSMSAYNQNEETPASQAWAVVQGGSAGSAITQQSTYVRFTKTNTGQSARWAWVRPAAAIAGLTPGTAYSIEVKARVNPIDKNTYPDNATDYEANQIALRIGGEKIAAPIFLRYGDAESGSLSTVSGGQNAYKMNTSDWQVYRMVFHADHATYDVYVEGVEDPVFTNVGIATTSDQNGIYFGAESRHRCNIDVEYVKMGTGDFFSKPRISSLSLSQDSHVGGNESVLTVTAHTLSIADGETLLVSLVDRSDKEIVAPVEAIVADNQARADLVMPASLAHGIYAVKVSAKAPVSGVEVEAKTITYEIKDPVEAQTWDVLNRNFSLKAWDESPAWKMEKGNDVPADFVTQKDAYININKTQAYGSRYYGFLTSPEVPIAANTAYTYEVKARALAIDKNEFPDEPKPTPSGTGGYEANQIGFLLNNKHISLYLLHGDENTGYVASPIADGTGVSPSYTDRYILNTSEWHVYRLIFNADNTKYDIYVDGELIFEEVPVFNKSGANVAKIGGESWQRCNMDIEYVRIATGDLVTGDKPKLTSLSLSSDSHIANHERSIQLTVTTSSIDDGEKLQVLFTDENDAEVLSPKEIIVHAGKADTDVTIPSSVPLGKYKISVAAAGGTIGGQALKPKSMQYVVVDVSPLETKMLPQVEPVGFVKEMSDYIYTAPSKEFIFPSIVDTKKSTVDGKFRNGEAPIDRYYLYYAPHENPGGIFLSTAPTMDGPWTEYAGSAGMTPGTVMDFAWAEQQSDYIKNGAERHISACQVVWNEVQNKYLMYFHGPNSATHYASSEDMVNWTFGGTILIAHQFSPIGAEASYAKTFEHEIPGLGNKYVLLLMNQENQIRRIYWAHSTDGINWTPVTKPLISPDLNYKKVPGTDRKPSYDGGGTGAYGNNVSGPFLMEKNGRYFVFCHGNADNLNVVEVGESFDMEVHWGEYLKSTDVMFNVNGKLTATRPAAPDFLQDDNGKWYMFFEAGGRLNANIGYAREGQGSGVEALPVSKGVSIYPSAIEKGEKLRVHAENADGLAVEIIGLSGDRISSTRISGSSGSVQAPLVSGLYFVKVKTTDNSVSTSKIIVR